LTSQRESGLEQGNAGKAVVGMAGTGLMGVGIATQSALHGHRTIVHDVDAARLASVAPKADAILDELIDAGRIDEAAKAAALARIETHAQLDVMVSARFVIEAIPEVLELKHRLYASLAGLLADYAILASNTSGFPPDALVGPLRAKAFVRSTTGRLLADAMDASFLSYPVAVSGYRL
jgi:3-hydroxybutyryl-CoA dehydrogenase